MKDLLCSGYRVVSYRIVKQVVEHTVDEGGEARNSMPISAKELSCAAYRVLLVGT